MSEEEKEDTYTIQELSDALNVPTHRLRKWTRTGELPRIKVGRRILYRWQAVKQFLDRHTINNKDE